AVVERRGTANQPPLVVRSDFLNIFPNQQIVQSNRPTVVQQGQTQFFGNSLHFNGVDGTSSMQGRVKAVIVPASPAPAAQP
ncbi:MAG: LPS export ABC transporter periplasmic protein LptC, partial [Thiomonas sp.]|nr:LPS export ABC transporter periplasmic protein LptC [Thiomonas sp.]